MRVACQVVVERRGAAFPGADDKERWATLPIAARMYPSQLLERVWLQHCRGEQTDQEEHDEAGSNCAVRSNRHERKVLMWDFFICIIHFWKACASRSALNEVPLRKVPK